MNYSFDVDVATYLKNVNEAVFVHNIAYWILHNKANDTNFNDGYYWTYNTQQAFSELFPFWTRRQIRTIVDNLKSKNILIVNQFNKKNYDQTKWYTLNHSFTKEFYKEIYIESTNNANGQIGQFDNNDSFMQKNTSQSTNDLNGQISQLKLTKKSISIDQSVNPIPNINTNINTNNNNILAIEENFENLWSLFPNKKGKASVNKKSKEYFYNLGFEKSKEIIQRYLDYVSERRKEFSSLNYQNGSTFFNSGYVDYLDENYTEYKAKVYNKPQQTTNYEQRKYDDDFFDNLYDNVEYIK